jgi:hypothetical protein
MAPELTVAGLLKVRFRKLLFAPLGREVALGTAQQGLLVVDPRPRTPLARVLMHELIHVVRPLWSEGKTLREERRLWRVATWQEKAQLFKLLGKGEIWDGSHDFQEELDDKTDIQTGS